MNRVDKATFAPGECLITHSPTGPFIDCQLDFDWRHDGRMYVGYQAVRQMAELFEFVPKDRHEKTLSELDEARKELEAQAEELESLRRFKTQTQAVFESAGFSRRGKPGRPPKNKETANV